MHYTYTSARRMQSTQSILILSSLLCLGLQSGIFRSGFPTKHFSRFSTTRCVLHVLLISSPFSWSHWWYLVSSKELWTSSCLFLLLPPPLLYPSILGSAVGPCPSDIHDSTITSYYNITNKLYRLSLTGDQHSRVHRRMQTHNRALVHTHPCPVWAHVLSLSLTYSLLILSLLLSENLTCRDS
jgi:hypothetical protein